MRYFVTLSGANGSSSPPFLLCWWIDPSISGLGFSFATELLAPLVDGTDVSTDERLKLRPSAGHINKERS